MKIQLPFGRKFLDLELNDLEHMIDVLTPRESTLYPISPELKVETALSHPVGVSDPFCSVTRNTFVAITVNDKTRPVPNAILLPPLINKLGALGVPDSNITFFIASGTHIPMHPDEYQLILPESIMRRFAIEAHNCDDEDNLCEIGTTKYGTPVVVNKRFYHHDLKIVVGDIELHHFAGYSGGVKSGAIGMSSRVTINSNHKLLLDPGSRMGEYDQNPLRQDIEEIGRMIGINYSLNAVLNENKDILDVFFGDPVAVMQKGIEVVKDISRVDVVDKYDLVIASAGGYPKDINLYQAQKAMTHASFFCKPEGSIMLFAECCEGVGSDGYLEFMWDVSTIEQVITKFTQQGFSVGPHKALQIARILMHHDVFLHSTLPDDLVSKLFLRPFDYLDLTGIIRKLDLESGRIAILPYATACIPVIKGEKSDS